jgi:hypothetical protein
MNAAVRRARSIDLEPARDADTMLHCGSGLAAETER